MKYLQSGRRRKIKRLIIAASIVFVSIFFVFLPVALSFLITNSHFRFPERGPRDPEALGLKIDAIEFQSDDGIPLRGWWNPGDSEKPLIIFVHGLNRSRLEHLERAAESSKRGYGILLFDLRNHGESGNAYTTLGITESHDVCAARAFANREAPERPQVLWGVSLGASTALLAERQMSRLQRNHFGQLVSIVLGNDQASLQSCLSPAFVPDCQHDHRANELANGVSGARRRCRRSCGSAARCADPIHCGRSRRQDAAGSRATPGVPVIKPSQTTAHCTGRRARPGLCT